MTQSDDAKGGYRLAHIMMRVRDLDRALDFYVRLLGMEVLKKIDYPDGRFTNTFIGYGRDATTKLELTHNWDQEEPYDVGTGFGHLAIEVTDVYAACERLAAEGVKITSPPGPLKDGTRNVALAVDPDGYTIELLEPR